MKANVQAFGDILDIIIELIPVSDEDVEITQTLTYLGIVIHSSPFCEIEVNRRLGRVWSAANPLDEGVWRCRSLCKRTKIRVSRSLVLPFLLFSCENWTHLGVQRA